MGSGAAAAAPPTIEEDEGGDLDELVGPRTVRHVLGVCRVRPSALPRTTATSCSGIMELTCKGARGARAFFLS